MRTMPKKILALVLVLALLLPSGTALARCRISGKSISTSVVQLETKDGLIPCIRSTMICNTDTPGHPMALSMDLLIDGKFITTVTGTDVVSLLYYPEKAAGSVTTVVSGYCTVCHRILPAIYASDQIWEKVEEE